MNRYIIEGIINDALAGKSVVIFGRIVEARRLFGSISQALRDDTERRSLVNGMEWVQLENGATVRRAHDATDLRGLRADVVFLPREFGNDQEALTEALLTVTTTNGEVIRA